MGRKIEKDRNMANKLKERLGGNTLIFDGAVGTELYKKNFFLNTSYESLCLSSPKIVKEIHESYRNAGAMAYGTVIAHNGWIQVQNLCPARGLRSM